MPNVSHLECSVCGSKFEAGRIHNLCQCGGVLLVRYDLDAVRRSWNRDSVAASVPTLWRYAPVLPVRDRESIVSLGEGMTPLIRARRLGAAVGAERLWVKDEGLNPTGSFKARGMSCAISMAVELGIKKIAIPSAGNAASAAAAYSAAAGIEAHIFMPADVPQSNYIECKALGAHVTLVDGLISDCGRMVAERKDREGWFDMSTLKEPYRVEGKKTMGYEVAEQFDWELPDAIFYPTGGGVGLIGMWKAFEEMEELGWIGSKRPKMIAVQAAGCQPVVRAFEQGLRTACSGKSLRRSRLGCGFPHHWETFLCSHACCASGGTADRGGGCGDPGCGDRTGDDGGHFRGSGRSGLHRGAAETAGQRLFVGR